MDFMKVAIIGAGFAGLGTAWHLIQQNPDIDITIFDDLGIGGEASGIAAGLLHPFVGLRAKLNLYGNEAYESTCRLLMESENFLKETVYSKSGLLRMALTPSQQNDFLECSKTNPDVKYLKNDECQNLNPACASYPGILIAKGTTVYVKAYLKGLFLSLTQKGVKLEKSKINNLSDLKQFDKVIVTAGAGVKQFAELGPLEVFLIKGQTLELEWPKDLQPLSVPLSSSSYILMNQDKQSCIAGATYERNYLSSFRDQAFAQNSIMPKTVAMIPGLKDAKIIDCKAALRVSTKDHMPIVEKINERLFVYVGLGSKGLLYHSFFAEKLAMLCLKV